MLNSKLLLNSASIVRTLAIMASVLILLSLASVVADDLTGHNFMILHKLDKLFYVDFEMNVPSFFSALILLFASVILTIITVLKRRQKDLYSIYWTVLSIGFLFMTFDELVSVHERMIEPMREILGGGQLGIFYFAWVIPMGVLVFLLAIFFFRFWWDLPLKTKIYFAVAATIYLGGAVGFELIESKHCEIYGKENPFYIFLTTTEETFEMFGVIIFIKALLEYATAQFGEVQLQLYNFPHETDLFDFGRYKSPNLPQKPRKI